MAGMPIKFSTKAPETATSSIAPQPSFNLQTESPSLDLRKPEHGFLETFLRFVQIRMNPRDPGLTPVQVATGFRAQEPPAGLLELLGHERGVHAVAFDFLQRALERLAEVAYAGEGVFLRL